MTLFLRTFAVLLAVSLIWFAVQPSAGVGFLVKVVALSFAVSLLITVFYPELRGVQKGDKVVIVMGNMPVLFGRSGVAITSGRVNNEIRIKLDDGKEAVGIIESYEGMLSAAKIRLLYEERLTE